MNYQRLLLDHLDLIKLIVTTTGRRRHLAGTELDDFASFVHLRLIEDDYAILRKFQHRSQIGTYLTAVIERLSLDFLTTRWGRWRPSAIADKLGPLAVMLERLVRRDRHTLEEAFELVRAAHGRAIDDAQLWSIWDQLPERVRTVEVPEDAAVSQPSQDDSEAHVEDAALQDDVERLERALQSGLAQIPPKDRVVIALRYDENLSIAEIAKLTNSSVPTLHRRLERNIRTLRAALLDAGFGAPEVARLIGHARIAVSPLLRAEVESFRGPVRLFKRDG